MNAFNPKGIMPSADTQTPEDATTTVESADAADDLAQFFAEHDGSPSSDVPDDELQIGARLAQARAAAGLTRRTLAGHLGVTESAIAEWESGLRTPSGNRMSKLAGMLGVSLSWILIGRGVEPTEHDHPYAQIRSELQSVQGRLTDALADLDRLDGRLEALAG